MSALTGTVLQGRYKLEEELARGGMGVVYRAERLQLGRTVAIKFLSGWSAESADAAAETSEARKRFELEARAMGAMHHPNCVTVTDFGLHDGVPYLVMDYVPGETLRAAVENVDNAKGRRVGLSAARASLIAERILAGLAHAHSHGIVHRDIKPANIVVSNSPGFDDEVKVLDFGVAKLQADTSNLTAGMAIGTPAYMAPEQAMGSRVDARTDLYAVGVLLHYMLTGRKPFVHDDAIEVLRMHREQPRPDLSDSGVPAALAAVVSRAMAVDPEARFQTAADMAQALRAARTTPAPSSKADDHATPPMHESAAAIPAAAIPDPAAKSKSLLIGGGIAIALIGLIGIVAATGGGSDGDSSTPVSRGTVGAKGSSDAEHEGSVTRAIDDALATAKRDNRRGARILEALARIHPNDARVHHALGHVYFARPWWPRGFAAYRRAIAIDPALARDDMLLTDAIRALSSESSHHQAGRFLLSLTEAHALISERLESLAQTTSNKKLAARARRLASELAK